MLTNQEIESIYFGDNYVPLFQCTGTFHSFSISKINQFPLTPESIASSLKNLQDLSYISPSYKNYYTPCVPDTNITLSSNISTLPECLSIPLIKLKNDKNKNFTKGIISGHRSVILKDEKTNKYYRLKGCGNDLLGFTLLKDEGYIEQINIRGCQFEVTAARELFFSYKIGEELAKFNIPCGNIPVGYWMYDKDLKLIGENVENLKPENSVPELQKYCGLFETLSERRLRTHLMGGIEIIIRAICKVAIEKYGLNEEEFNNSIITLFPGDRKSTSIITGRVVPNHSPPFINKKPMPLSEWIKTPIYEKPHYDKIISYSTIKNLFSSNSNQALDKIIKASNDINEYIKQLKQKLPSDKQLLLDKISSILLSKIKDNKSILEHLLDIYIRIGYETAKIKRIMVDSDINWGTFVDHGPFAFHCNAHSNNLVVLPKGYNNICAPLDFDLAFEKKNFICIVEESKTYGQKDDYYFDNYMSMEIYELACGLCGMENMNFSYSDQEQLAKDSFEDKVKEGVRFILCDCLLECYMKTFDKVDCEHVINDIDGNEVLQGLIEMALVITHDKMT